jgi:hypothetical protein
MNAAKIATQAYCRSSRTRRSGLADQEAVTALLVKRPERSTFGISERAFHVERFRSSAELDLEYHFGQRVNDLEQVVTGFGIILLGDRQPQLVLSRLQLKQDIFEFEPHHGSHRFLK